MNKWILPTLAAAAGLLTSFAYFYGENTELNLKAARLEAQVTELNRDADAAADQVETLNKALADREDRIENTNALLMDSNGQLEVALDESETAEKMYAKEAELTGKLTQELATANEKFNASHAKVEELTLDLASEAKRIGEFKALLLEAKASVAKVEPLTKQILVLDRQIESLEAELEQTRKKVADSKDESVTLKQVITEQAGKIEFLENDLLTAQSTVKQTKESALAMRDEVLQHLKRIDELKATVKELESRPQ